MADVQIIDGPIPIEINEVGPRGPKGWTPIIVGVPDGARKVLLLADWTGGANPKPATGYIGPAGLVADIADAVDFAGRGLLSVEQDVDANLVINYNDNSTDIIPAYFAPMLAAAAEVDADAQAVELSRQAVVGIQADVVTRQTQINQTKLDADAARDTALTHKTGAENAATNSAASAAAAASLVLGVATNRPSLRPSLLLDFANARTLPPGYTFSRSTTATYRDAMGNRKTVAANVPRIHFDSTSRKCLGFYGESISTNYIRNPNMIGAVVGVLGSGGALPTNWSVTGDTSVTREIVGTGIENGTNYIDVRIYGTPTVTYLDIYQDSPSTTPASSGQLWSFGCDVKLLAGSLSNILNMRINMTENSSGAFIRSTSNTSLISIDSTSRRFIISATLADASTNQTRSVLSLNFTTGQPVDITLRIAAPQLEQGDPTSFIPAPGTTNAVLTRATDVLTYPVTSDWYNPAEGTLFVEFVRQNLSSGATIAVLQLDGNNQIRFVCGAASPAQIRVDIITGGNTMATVSLTSASTANTVYRMCASWKAGALAASLNGAAVITGTPASIPAGLTQMVYPGGNIFRLRTAYFPKALSNTEVQALAGIGLLSGKDANQLPTVADLGEAAFMQLGHLLAMRNRQEFQSEGTGVSRTITIRRPYDFTFALVDSTAVTVTAQPSASCVANTNYSLTFNAPAGTILSYSITPIFS